jgi:hypothetical protein
MSDSRVRRGNPSGAREPHHPQGPRRRINFFDTADVYSRGESEEIVGKALKGRRDDVVLATKVGHPMGDGPQHRGAARRWIMAEVENSLRRLQTDHIDLYQIHRPDPETDIEETLSALTDLVRSGKVRSIGASATPASDIVEAQWVAERSGLERFRTERCNVEAAERGEVLHQVPVRIDKLGRQPLDPVHTEGGRAQESRDLLSAKSSMKCSEGPFVLFAVNVGQRAKPKTYANMVTFLQELSGYPQIELGAPTAGL